MSLCVLPYKCNRQREHSLLCPPCHAMPRPRAHHCHPHSKKCALLVDQVNDPRTAEVFAPVWDKATNNWTVLDDVSMWYNEVGPAGKVGLDLVAPRHSSIQHCMHTRFPSILHTRFPQSCTLASIWKHELAIARTMALGCESSRAYIHPHIRDMPRSCTHTHTHTHTHTVTHAHTLIHVTIITP
jgi:hypothetical protein